MYLLKTSPAGRSKRIAKRRAERKHPLATREALKVARHALKHSTHPDADAALKTLDLLIESSFADFIQGLSPQSAGNGFASLTEFVDAGVFGHEPTA